MKNIFTKILLIVIPFCFSSCFQIIEEITLKPNGSGDAILTLNLSASRSKVASIMLLDSINGYKVPSKQNINTELDDIVVQLKKMPGLSNVKKTLNLDNYIATVSFNFQNVSAINNAKQSILKKLKMKTTNNAYYTFNKANNTFSSNFEYNKEIALHYKKLKGEVKNIFKEATYTGIYRFEKEVKAFDNKTAKVSKSKKAVMLKAPILDLINGKITLSNSIQLTQ